MTTQIFVLEVPLSTMLPVLLVLAGFCCAIKAIHSLFWHPLSHFPGPLSHACSGLPYVYHQVSGNLAVKFLELHEEYGPVVRTAPNELSFVEPEALSKIYAEPRPGCPVFPKNYDSFKETRNQISQSVFLAGHSDHARMRAVINQAFSRQALYDQEPRIQSHVQSLIHQIDVAASKSDRIVDLNQWYNFAAFDIIADAALGEPFNTLEDTTYRSWITMVGKTWKVLTIASALKSMARPIYLLRRLVPTGTLVQKEVHKFDLVLNRVKERISVGGTDRIDLLSRVLKHNDRKEKMTDPEIIANATLFVAAGTETVSTVLSALTNLITTDSRVMAKLVAEIRGRFSAEESITFHSVSQLQYLTACIREALRRFPPIPEGLPRIVPKKGAWISGHWVPGGVSTFSQYIYTAFSSTDELQTLVQSSILAANLSSSNFKDPECFIPERWLGDEEYSNDKKQASQPFSVGPRNCVGQNIAMAEMRLVMARLLWSFDVRGVLQEGWMDQPTYLLWKRKPLPIELIRVHLETPIFEYIADMPRFLNGHLQPNCFAGFSPNDMETLLEQDYMKLLPQAAVGRLPLLTKSITDLVHPDVCEVHLVLLRKLEIELKKFRASWDSFWRLSGAQSCRIAQNRSKFPYDDIKMFKDGLRDATIKGGQAIRDNDFQILEESARNLRLEIIRIRREG
ncbi:MAG: hypothetical protein Q9168_005498 [Polycauliona sp. 1 TL-2023]